MGIKDRRESSGLRKEDVAVQSGVPWSTLSGWEQYPQVPQGIIRKYRSLRLVLSLIGMTEDELMGEEGDDAADGT